MRLFSFKGRAGRLEYLVHNLLDDFIMIALMVIIIAVMAAFEGEPLAVITMIVGIVCIVVVFVLGIAGDAAVTVRRLHDLGRSGKDLWILMIPIYNFFLGLSLLFQKGIELENEYGPDPLVKYSAPGISSKPEALNIKEQIRTFPDS